MSRLRGRIVPLAALTLVALATAASPASARTLEVTTAFDNFPGSLRTQLGVAAGGDVVHVPAGTYVLNAGPLSVAGGVTVAGDGARATIVSGGHASGVFETGGAEVVLQDLTITAGRALGGGGVASDFGLTLHRVAVLDNAAKLAGGGLFVQGPQPLVVDHSLIAGNQVTQATAGGSGGGIDLRASSLGSAIVASTIAGNATPTAGGGISTTSAVHLLLDGDTLAGNTVTGSGGMGGNLALGGDVRVRNSALAGGVAERGGNCYLDLLFDVTLTSLGHNAQSADPRPDAGCQAALNAPTDRAGLDLRLAPLADNGGPTDTLLPGAGSPLLDGGDAGSCTATDQRGLPRPLGGGCDVGAVERTGAVFGAGSVDGVTTTSATLHDSADTGGLGGSARFALGLTSGYGAFTTALTLPAAPGGQGASAQLSGLTPATTYHFQLLVTTPDGAVASGDRTFTTARAASSPPATTRCLVPKLAGRTLIGARRLLARAHCKLGMVKRPRVRSGARRPVLVVRTQSRRARSRLAAGTRVGVTLGSKRARRRGR